MEFSSTVKVVDVKGNDGGFGATATLQSIQPSVGIDFTLGGPDTDTAEFQVTVDTAQMVKPGAVLRLTVSDQNVKP